MPHNIKDLNTFYILISFNIVFTIYTLIDNSVRFTINKG